MTTNWNLLLNNKRNMGTVSNFAKGDMSGKEFVSAFAGTNSGGTARSLLRTHGVDKSRTLAKKALYRRESSQG
jgi:hypothetical protein